MNDADDRKKLVVALKGGAKSLGDIRRDDDIQPTVVERIATSEPETFRRTDVGGKPGIELRPPLSNLDRKLFRIIKEHPVSTVRLERSHRVKEEQAEAFAKRHKNDVDLVDLPNRQGQVRKFLRLKGAPHILPAAPLALSQAAQDAPEAPAGVMTAAELTNAPINDSRAPATPPPLNSEIAARFALLLLFLADSWKSSDWLPLMGFPMAWVHEIMCEPAYAGLIRLERNEQVGHFEYRVSLVKKPEPAPQHSIIQKAPQPAAPFPLSDAELEKMKWKPGGDRSMHPEKMSHRTRRPLVTLPPAP